MRRRAFIQALAGLSATPIVAKIGFLERLIPVVNNENYWKWVKFTGWKEDPSFLGYSGQIWGERSDGQFFYVHLNLPEEYRHAKGLIEAKIENGYAKFDTFRNCECVSRYQTNSTEFFEDRICKQHGGDGYLHRETREERQAPIERENEEYEKSLLTETANSA